MKARFDRRSGPGPRPASLRSRGIGGFGWIPSVLVFLLPFLLAGCTTTPAPPTSYYLLSPASREEAPELPEGPTLRVSRVQVAAHVRGIALIRPDQRVDTVVYHRWASPPETMVEEWVREELLQTGAFRFVAGTFSPVRTDYTLELEVRRLDVEVPERGGAPRGVVVLEGLLYSESPRAVRLSRRWSGFGTSGEGGVAGVVAALREALDEASARLAEDLARAVGSGIEGSPPAN